MTRISFRLIALAAVLCLSASQSSAQTGRQRGATLGGLAGAVAGGLIGDNNNEAGAGAGIGAVVGAVAGGLLGDAADKDRAIAQQQRYYQNQQQQFYQQQQQIAVQQSAVSMNDVISMTRSGLSDSIIINQIQQRGFGRDLQVADIISLHQNGVRESVISALQRAPSAQQAVVSSVAKAPVYVERQVIVEQPVIHHRVVPAPVIVHPARVVTPHYYRHPGYRNTRRSGLNIRF